jgi:purine-binding chemotaxis protein CheW
LSAGDDVRQILRARAAALAAPLPAAQSDDVVELVVFRAGNERYAIEAIEAEEAIEVGDVTPVPGLPPFYLGLIVHAGVVYPLVDVRPLAGAPVEFDLQPAQALLFLSSERAIAVAAEWVESFVRIDTASIADGKTSDGIVLLDLQKLLADVRLVVDHG